MKVGIIGGGIAGLTAANELAKKGHSVTVFERDHRLGGQADTFEIAGERIEKLYHHIFTHDTEMINLLKELGLENRLVWIESKVGFWRQGKIYAFVTPGDLLRFKPISLFNRMRLGLVSMYLRGPRDWHKLEQVTAREWITRWAGRKNFEVVWEPLLRAKFGESADQISMAWFWGKIHIRFTSRKGMQKERLGYLTGSFGVAIDALAQRIVDAGGKIYLRCPVRQVVIDQGKVKGLKVAGEAGGSHDFDAVVATTPSNVFLELLPELEKDYSAKLQRTRYQAALCLVLTMKRSLSHIYWLNISDPSVPFVAAIEHTNFVDKSSYGGKTVLYLSNYLAKEHPLYLPAEKDLLELYLPHLKRINPDFERDWIEDVHLFREDAAQPIITTNYSRQIPDHRTPVSGLYLANTTQIYPEDRGLNYSVLLGKRVSKLVDPGS